MTSRTACSIVLVLALGLAAPAALAMDKLGGPGGGGGAAGGSGGGLPTPTPVGGTSSGGPAIGPRGGAPAPAAGVTSTTGSPARVQRDRDCVQVAPGEAVRAAAPVYPGGTIVYGRGTASPPPPGPFEPSAPGTIALSPGC